MSRGKLSVWRRLRGLFTVEQWNIGRIDQSIEDLIEGAAPRPRIRWLLSPSRKKYYADPFPLSPDSGYIFFETYDYAAGKGYISGVRFTAQGEAQRTEGVMDQPYHLSYPFVFLHEGDLYMIPEEWVTRRITLYRCRRFPSEWEPKSILVENVEAVDVTLFQYGAFWWLTFSPKQDPFASLMIYYAPSVFGPWVPHRKNPVKTDATSTRPAGRPFMYKGNLIRPAQDCSTTYGGRVVLNEIVRLTPEEFEERPLQVIAPSGKDRFNRGIHTLNPVDRAVLVDGKRYIISLKPLKKALTKTLRPLLPKRGRYAA